MKYLKRHEPFLVLIGPSGSGKSSLAKMLHRKKLVLITPSWTTRPPRKKELPPTLEHRFVTEIEFMNKKGEEFFLETVRMFGLLYQYGLPLIESSSERISLIILRAQLIPLLKKHYDNFVIYQIEDTKYNIRKRIRSADRSGEAVGSRLRDFDLEIESGRKIARRIFVNRDFASLKESVLRAIYKDFKIIKT